MLQGIPDRSAFGAEQGTAEPTPPEWLQAFDEEEEPPVAADPLSWLDQESDAVSPAQPDVNEISMAQRDVTWSDEELGNGATAESGQVVEDDPMAWMSSLKFDSGPAAEQPDEKAEANLDALRRASMPPSDFDANDFWGGPGSADKELTGTAAEEPSVPQSDVNFDAPPESVPPDENWLAEPEYDFFASSPASESPAPDQENALLNGHDDDWLADLEVFEGSELVQVPAEPQLNAMPPTEMPAEWSLTEATDSEEAEQPLEMGGVPDWMSGAAPVEGESEVASFDALFGEEQPQQDEQPLEVGGVLDWVSGAAPVEAESEVASLDALFGEEQPQQDEQPLEMGGVPDWMSGAAPVEGESEVTSLDALFGEEQPQQDEQPLEVGGVPDWMSGAAPVEAESEVASFDALFGEEQPQQDEQPLEMGGVSDWMSGAAPAEAESEVASFDALFGEEQPQQDEQPLEMGGVSDWLSGAAPVEAESEVASLDALFGEEQPQQDEQPLEMGGVSDWMSGAAPAEAELEVASFDALFGEEQPQQDEQPLEMGGVSDWMSGATPAEAESEVASFDALFGEEQPQQDEQPLDAATMFQEASQELDWLPKQTSAEEDWLGSFAKPEETLSPASGQNSFQEDAWLADLPPADIEQPFSSGVEEEEPEIGIDAQQEVSWQPSVPDFGEPEAKLESPADFSAQEELPPADTSASAEDNFLSEPYDPFAAGRVDQIPTYQAAKETGILQPDEVPDWMLAFSEEEPPLEAEDTAPEPEAALSEEGLDLDWENLNIDEPQSAGIVEDRQPEMQIEDMTIEPETAAPAPVEELEDDSGEMPEWLLAITQSEADKLDDLLPANEPETYLSAQETGVLQPGQEMEWLASATDELFDADLSNIEPAPDDLLADLERVAQPADMTDTKEVVLEEETGASFDFSFDDEFVPDDFSFEEVQPAWLRHPHEDDQKSAKQTGKASNGPEWLRNAFEDSDTE